MTSRSFDGVGYYAPSFSSDTPIYDSLVAERGVPQIAPINVPAALPPAFPSPYDQPRYGGYESSGSNFPALPPARPALGPGPSSTTYMPAQAPAPQYAAAQHTPQYGSPQPYVPGQRMPGQGTPQPGMPPMQQGGQGQQGGYGYPAPGQSFGGNGLRPAAPVAPVAPVRPMPQRPTAPNQYGEQQQQQYPRNGYQGGY